MGFTVTQTNLKPLGSMSLVISVFSVWSLESSVSSDLSWLEVTSSHMSHCYSFDPEEPAKLQKVKQEVAQDIEAQGDERLVTTAICKSSL